MMHTRGVANKAAKRGAAGAHASGASASAVVEQDMVAEDAASEAADDGELDEEDVEDMFDEWVDDEVPRDIVLNDPDRYSHPVLRKVVQLGNWCYFVSSHDRFTNMIFAAIGFAATLVAVRTYPGMDTNPVVSGLDTFVLYIFVLEVVLKVFANPLRPHLYWVGPDWKWNNFDFAIVAMCILPLDLPGGGGVVALRMFRLMRVVKIIKKIPQLQVIFMGLVGGMQSMMYIVLLLLLVFYIYGCAGVFWFRDNDPWHFGDLGIAQVTLFRMVTMEDWADIEYINYYGCDEYPEGGGVKYVTTVPLEGTIDQQCKPNATGFLSVMFCTSFLIVGSFVILSMFIGTMTMSMEDEILALNEQNEAKRKLKRKEDNEKKKVALEKEMGHTISAGDGVSEEDFRRMSVTDQHKLRLLTQLMHTAFGGDDGDPDGDNHVLPSQTKDDCWSLWMNYVAEPLARVTATTTFRNLITSLVVVSGLVVGCQTEPELNDAITSALLASIEGIILLVFIAEAFLKIVSHGSRPWDYFADRWNIFDFLIIIGSGCSTILSSGGGGSAASIIRMMRLLRLFLVFKFMKGQKQLRVITGALFQAMSAIGYIGMILFLVFFLFAAFGCIIFGDNDPWHFGNFHLAMITLFRLATLEDWTDVMYVNMFGCDKFAYSSNGMVCTAPTAFGLLSVAYFIIFTVIGSLVLLSLFIGVITTAMSEAQDKLKEEDEKEDLFKQIVKKGGLKRKHVQQFQDAFDMLDTEADGSLTVDELTQGLKAAKVRLPEDKIVEMVHQVDADGSGEIEFIEFVEFMTNAKAVSQGKPPPLNIMRAKALLAQNTVKAFLEHRDRATAVKPISSADLDKFTANLRKPVFVEDKLQCAKSHVLQFAGALAKFTAENSRHRTDGLATKMAQAVEVSARRPQSAARHRTPSFLHLPP